MYEYVYVFVHVHVDCEDIGPKGMHFMPQIQRYKVNVYCVCHEINLVIVYDLLQEMNNRN